MQHYIIYIYILQHYMIYIYIYICDMLPVQHVSSMPAGLSVCQDRRSCTPCLSPPPSLSLILSPLSLTIDALAHDVEEHVQQVNELDVDEVEPVGRHQPDHREPDPALSRSLFLSLYELDVDEV